MRTVERAILTLGRAFLADPRNRRLRDRLRDGRLDAGAYYRQLVAYAFRLLLGRTTGDGLLAPESAFPDLLRCRLSDDGRMVARELSGTVAAADLGRAHEHLLSLRPTVDPATGRFDLAPVAGHERKTSGSYFTPPGLIDCLLETALDPLIESAVKTMDPESALLALRICDPACGSGNLLVAAARRIAARLAAVRSAGVAPPAAAALAAFADVSARCVFGIDRNPLAVELCRATLAPDGHVLHTDSLLGIPPAAGPLPPGLPPHSAGPSRSLTFSALMTAAFTSSCRIRRGAA